MGLSQKDTYGADGALSGLTFDPEKLYLVVEPDHPLYDERVHDPIDDAMVRNIMKFGVIEPVVISRDPATGRVDVVAGRQRVKCAREANHRLHEAGQAPILVPTTIRKTYDGAELAAVAVSENEIRRPDGPMVKARKMRHLETMGHSIAQIAVAFGCTEKTVENTTALLDCGKPVQKAVEGGLIGISDVKYLARLNRDQQTAKVEEIVKSVVGKEGHARARAKREVLQADNPKATAPKLKTRAQIEAKLKEVADCGPVDAAERKGWREALEWIIGAPAEPEKDTKTRDLVDELETEGAK